MGTQAYAALAHGRAIRGEIVPALGAPNRAPRIGPVVRRLIQEGWR